MPKHYLSSDNLENSLFVIANNMKNNFNLKDWEVSTYVSRLLKGIIDDKTIAKYFPKKYKKPYGILETCGICGKRKIRSMSRHMSNSHPKS